MKILIVEDDANKLRQIRDFLHHEFPDADLAEGRSYQSGLKAALSEDTPDVVVLDMTMPTFDVSAQEKGGRPRAFAGREILGEMKRKSVQTRVVVLTQFETFGEGDDEISLPELTKELRIAFPEQFVGSVYYHPSQSDWKDRLPTIIRSLTS